MKKKVGKKLETQKTYLDVKVAEGAIITGDVTIDSGSSIWYHAVIRGDGGSIKIGKNTNIQECCVIHESEGGTVTIGDGVTVGHGAILHGCTIGNYSLIGMGSILLDQAVIGNHCIIGAGSLVTGGKEIPDGSLVFGNPAKIIRSLREDEIQSLYDSVEEYKKWGENLNR